MMATRWSAIGAAVAVSLGAGGVGLSQAAVGSGAKPVFVAITPCRLVDTRPATQIGPKGTPLGPDETLTQQITGSVGQCAGIPADAVAAALNVTAIAGTARSFLSVYPADAPLPNASNLNWDGGDPPTPNKVDVDLSADGAVKMTNAFGTVHLAADLVGYYVDHTHDDRYYTKQQADGRYAGQQALADVYTKQQSDDAFVTPDEAAQIVAQANFQLHRISLSGSAFTARRPAVADAVIDPFGALYVFSGTDDSFEAPINLPDGAWIGGLHAWVEDDVVFASPEPSLSIQLRKVSHTGAYGVLLSVGSQYQPTITELTATPTDIIEVDNSTNSYVVSVDMPNANWGDHGDAIRLKAVVIEYLGPG